jgi:hypothetical protein
MGTPRAHRSTRRGPSRWPAGRGGRGRLVASKLGGRVGELFGVACGGVHALSRSAYWHVCELQWKCHFRADLQLQQALQIGCRAAQ